MKETPNNGYVVFKRNIHGSAGKWGGGGGVALPTEYTYPLPPAPAFLQQTSGRILRIEMHSRESPPLTLKIYCLVPVSRGRIYQFVYSYEGQSGPGHREADR